MLGRARLSQEGSLPSCPHMFPLSPFGMQEGAASRPSPALGHLGTLHWERRGGRLSLEGQTRNNRPEKGWERRRNKGPRARSWPGPSSVSLSWVSPSLTIPNAKEEQEWPRAQTWSSTSYTWMNSRHPLPGRFIRTFENYPTPFAMQWLPVTSLTPPAMRCVALGELLSLSGPWCPQRLMG